MNDSKRYRGVVIGCGKIGATFEMESSLPKPASHAAALCANPRTTLTALVDPDPAAVQKAGEYYRVPTYTDAKECVEKLRPDIVVIATPPQTHEELLSLVLSLDTRAVICEKPVSDTPEAAARMLALAKRSGSIVILNHQRRFLPLFIAARKRIAAGELGEIQQVSAYYTNGLLNNGTHLVDALQFLLNDTVRWAIGVTNERNTTAPFGGKNIDGLIGFSTGAVTALQSLDNASFGIHEIRILGKKGALIIGRHGTQFAWVPVQEGVTFAGVRELDGEGAVVEEDTSSMLEHTLAHTLDCLEGKAVPGSTLEEGYQALRILDALVRSAAQNSTRVNL